MSKVIGFTCGAFDLLHAGHLHLLSEAKRQCDELWIGLHTDPRIDRSTKSRPVQSMFERFVQLDSTRFVDAIIPYDTEYDLMNMMAVLPIKKRFIGSDYLDKPITASDVCKKRSIEIVYVDRLHEYSSTQLRSRLK